MAIVVLIVGALLTILGIAGYIYGLDLMPTERGIAGVISSSVIVVGGVLTVAMGLVLRKLETFGKILGLGEIIPQAPVVETPAVAAPAPKAEAPVEMPVVVPVAPEPALDTPPVAIEAPKGRPEMPKVALPKFDLPRPSLKTAGIVAGTAAAGAAAAAGGRDAVEKALSPDAPAKPGIAPLNLPKITTRTAEAQPEKPALRPHEVEYPVEVLAAAETMEAEVAPEVVAATPATEAPLPEYPEVPMPPPDLHAADAFEAELERLMPLVPAEQVKAAAAAEKAAEQDVKKAETKPAEAKPVEPKPEKRKGGEKSAEKPADKPARAEEKPAPVPEPAKEEPVAPAAPPEPAIAAEVAPVSLAPILPAPGAEVVGAYESGGAKYTMYSDGSVIAEAEGQTMFFKSLDELREFIDGGAKG